LRDRGRAQFNGGAIVRVRVIESPLARVEVHTHDLDEFILEDHFVMTFLFDGNGFVLSEGHGGQDDYGSST
jgi:hypothetical protein